MRGIILFLLFAFALTGVSACCCSNKTNEVNEIDFFEDSENLEDIKPLDYMTNAAKLQKANQEIIMKMNEASLNSAQEEELERELIQNQEKLKKLTKAFNNSKFFNDLEKSQNPMIRKAMDAQKQANQAMEMQQKMIEDYDLDYAQ